MMDGFYIGLHCRNQVPEVRVIEQELRLGVIENKCQIIPGESDVQRKKNRASLRHTVIAFEKSVAVIGEECHSISGLDSHFLEGDGQAIASLGEFGIGVTIIAAYDPDFVAVELPGTLFEP
jgi:hypothetical protein